MAIEPAINSPRKRAPRKRVVSKVVSKNRLSESSDRVMLETVGTETRTPERRSELSRRAPTTINASKIAQKKRRNQSFVIGAIFLVGIVSSAIVGFVDKGQIDVENTIKARNERIRNNKATAEDTITSSVVVPVQDTSRRADGGLSGRGTGGTASKSTPVSTPTASTSDNIASSSESIGSSTEKMLNEEVE